MCVRPISTRFCGGMLTPAMRAMLALPLPVPWVRADHLHGAVPADHLALLTDRFYRCPDLHSSSLLASHPADDGRAFIKTAARPLLEPVHDPAPPQVVGRKLDLDPVAREDPDVVHAHLARDVGEHLVVVVETN